MRIVFFGTPDFAVPCLQILLENGYDVVGCVTQPDKPQGRSMKLTPPPVKALAMAHGIPVFQPERLKEGQLRETLSTLAPDLCAVVAYGKILPDYVLKCAPLGCVNVHGSLLPAYRGAAPIQWAVLNGDAVSGVTTMYLDAGMDTGNTILRRETPIGENETAGELFDRLAALGAELLLDTLRAVEAGTAPSVPQNAAEATYAPMLTRELSPIDWRRSARSIHNQIRGLNPWPTATASLAGAPLKLYSSRVAEGQGAPGEILAVSAEGITVACGEGALLLCEVQAQGARRMPAGAFANGRRLAPGACFDLPEEQ